MLSKKPMRVCSLHMCHTCVMRGPFKLWVICTVATLLKQRCGMHTITYEIHTIYHAYPWYAMMSYQIWYVMHTIDLSAT